MTLPKAGDLLQSPNRAIREEAWTKIAERRYQDHEKLDILFNELRDLRHQLAVNAGFLNFRDYMFAAMGRFDYTPQDCFNFHEAVAETAHAVLGEARARGLAVGRAEGFEAVPGYGARAVVEGRRVAVGSARMFAEVPGDRAAHDPQADKRDISHKPRTFRACNQARGPVFGKCQFLHR